MPSPTDHARNERLLKLWASHPEISVSTIAQRFGIARSGVRRIIQAAREAGDARVQQDRRSHTR